MLSFTLDTNCIIEVDEGRPQASAIRQLADARAHGIADVAVVAIMASEKQRAGDPVSNFNNFQERLDRLGLAHLRLCLPMLYFDVTFLDTSLLSGPQEMALEREIHQILFPNVEFDFDQFCKARSIDARDPHKNQTKPWLNAKCDVQALWSHIAEKRDVFVTSDDNFHKATKKPALVALGSGRIVRPEDAVLLL